VGDGLQITAARHATSLFRDEDTVECHVEYITQWSGCCRGAECAALCDGEQASSRQCGNVMAAGWDVPMDRGGCMRYRRGNATQLSAFPFSLACGHFGAVCLCPSRA
jgi:hypothetical protein